MDLARARRAYEEFTGHKPTKARRAPLDGRNVAGWELGPLVGVAYEAVRDGERAQYFHEFKKSARPRLVSRDDGRQLYIEGGSYKVTDQGVTDMPGLFVVNPSPRKGKAMAKRRRKSTTRRKASAAPRTIVIRSNPAPKRRRRRAASAAPAKSRRRVYRRNPSPRGEKLNKLLVAGAGIGLGAVGAEIITGYAPLPANLKTGTAKHITKGVIGVAAGLAMGAISPKLRRFGKYVSAGAVAIAAHDVAKEFIVKSMPSIPFGGYGQFVPALGYANPGEMVSMGQFVPGFAGASGGGSGGESDFDV